jgi:hypothetical protein
MCNAARESVVRFDNGIRTAVQANILTVSHQAAKSCVAAKTSESPRLAAQPRTEVDISRNLLWSTGFKKAAMPSLEIIVVAVGRKINARRLI